jgi:hypothetical protein
MTKKIIKLTESDLTKIVKRVIEEQASAGVKGSFGKAKSNIPNARTRNYSVFQIKGTPKLAGKVITKGTKLGPSSIIELKKGDNIMMGSTTPEDKGKYFQGVELFLNDSGKFELFVNGA